MSRFRARTTAELTPAMPSQRWRGAAAAARDSAEDEEIDEDWMPEDHPSDEDDAGDDDGDGEEGEGEDDDAPDEAEPAAAGAQPAAASSPGVAGEEDEEDEEDDEDWLPSREGREGAGRSKRTDDDDDDEYDDDDGADAEVAALGTPFGARGDDDEEMPSGAIAQRTRANYSLADRELDELEAILNSPDGSPSRAPAGEVTGAHAARAAGTARGAFPFCGRCPRA